MADLEDTARYAIKENAEGTLRWLFPGLDADLAFDRFLDTNLITYPGETKRHCDTVARLRSRAGTQPSWALVLEVEARARRNILSRLLEYVARFLRKVRHGLSRGEDYQVGGAILVLTGKLNRRSIGMALLGTPARLDFSPCVVCLEETPARETLARIEGGELSRSVLPWIPLMDQGGEADVVEWWKRLAEADPSEDSRRDWAGLAKVFADRVGCLDVWEKSLEGWAMWKSKVIEEWRQDGRQEGRQEGRQDGRSDAIIDFLKARFPGQLTDEVAKRITAERAEAKLKEWISLAATAASFDDVRAKVMP